MPWSHTAASLSLLGTEKETRAMLVVSQVKETDASFGLLDSLSSSSPSFNPLIRRLWVTLSITLASSEAYSTPTQCQFRQSSGHTLCTASFPYHVLETPFWCIRNPGWGTPHTPAAAEPDINDKGNWASVCPSTKLS